MAIPIWKDKFCNLGAVASQYFRIRVSSTTIYQGRAYRATSSGNLYIRINDICADYMAQKVPVLLPSSAPGGMFPVSFTVQKSSNGSSWTTVETVDFNDDWSYDNSFDPSTNGMSFPITGRIDLRQKIVQTRYASSSVTVYSRYGGTSRSESLTPLTSTDFSAFYNAVAAAGKGRLEYWCNTHATYNGKTLTEVQMGTVTYTVTKACPRYCLYYKNPFGGYDHLLLEGAVILKRANSRETFKADYNNGLGMREEWDFMNETTASYEVNTGYLTEDESSRMPYLLDSPDVYLCDLENATVFIPVVIATDSYSYQSANRFGMKMRNHTFEVKVSQNTYKR